MICISNKTGDGIEQVKQALKGKVSAFTGNSGVGKSSLLNQIDPRLGLKTGEISDKLGRGRHTTRQVEMYELENGGLIADTPGFSSVDIEKFEVVLKDDLQNAFREFESFLGRCRFNGCSHIGEKGCAVIEAVENGIIGRQRYQSYMTIYEEIKNLKEWEIKK